MHADLGPFRLHYSIGRGGCGEVWRGVHRPSRTKVAIKLLHRVGEDTISALRAEAHAAAQMRHPNIATVIEVGLVPPGTEFQQGTPFLVTELGRSTPETDPPSTFAELFELLSGLLDGLAYAHAREVLHLDIKPANVIFTDDGPKLTDFGVAVTMGKAAVGGTPIFAAPEQLAGELLDQRADLFALGRTAEVLSRGLDTPQEWSQWCSRLTAPEREERYYDCAAAKSALLALAPRKEPPLSSRVPSLPLNTGLSLLHLRESSLVGREAEIGAMWDFQ